jgi:putative transcriptional regulator
MKLLGFLVLLLLAFRALALDASAAPRVPVREHAILDGQFLVASRGLTDPNFRHCVIFMVAHNGEGALGLVVNRVFGKISLKDLFGGKSIPKKAAAYKVDLHYGGPVEFQRGFVLHSDDYTGQATQLFRNGIALSADLGLVRAVAEGRGPKRAVFLAGYTGWSAGQLEREMARGDWLTAPADPELLFAADPESVWEKALRNAGFSM